MKPLPPRPPLPRPYAWSWSLLFWVITLSGCSLSRFGIRIIEKAATVRGFQEKVLIEGDHTIRYWVGGSGPPMLVLHGFGGDALSTWRPQLKALSAERTLILPDLLWFGQSHSSAAPGLDAQASALATVLRAEGHARVDAMGVSYGGFVLFKLGVLHPALLNQVIIVDSPGPVFTLDDEAALLDRFGVKDPEEIFIARGPEDVKRLLDLTLHHDRHFPDFLLEDMYKNIFSVHPEAQRGLIRDLHSQRDALSDSPLDWQEPLIVWGRHDMVFPVETGERLARTLGGRIAIMEDTAHGPCAEDPETFNQIVLQYLR
jgi:pimeloyl-ACP methyl ester carboxylesterase